MSELQEKAIRKTRNYMWWSMGAGLVPVPFLDFVAVSGVQLKMIADLSKLYGVSFEESRGKAVVGALLGFIVPQSLSCGMVGSLIKVIPGVGALAGAPAMALFAGGASWALGNVFIQHFESGGTLLDFNPDAMKEHFQEKFQEGQRVAANMEEKQTAEG